MEKRGMYKGKLTKKPKNATIIEGFAGYGLVATIATGFITDHLKCEKIGSFWFEDAEPITAIHKNELMDQVSVFYNKKSNIILVTSIINPKGKEWMSAQLLLDLAKELQAKEVITIEGVGGEISETTQGFFYSDDVTTRNKITKTGLQGLGEGIIVGVTGALLIKSKEEKSIKVTGFFAETQSQLPDSKAAAKIVEILDNYLGLKIDYKPLLKQAEVIEQKVKGILEKHAKTKSEIKEREINYVG